MKKPVEAIEMMREFYGSGRLWDDSVKTVLSYIDSIPEWPADLTRERLEELADQTLMLAASCDALRRLAAIAPKREKRRKAFLYERDDPILKRVRVWSETDHLQLEPGWRKVGEGEAGA